ncbi:phospholipid-transporting ATPase ABCA3-like [Melitaea cinxia]|uniref:phospholipid-transporting ATPase ABCA3-like n=1 Tax=Melitaea cinxia TaxID=113334 RepID=UPI001E270E2F|nr:phospholipid-transporting ATPase ABCA3-like [Melitaea cinxia]
MDYFEAAPRDLKPGIKILNVSKNYGKELALAEVSFNVYQGEITVLLGHNGAGKTTLMSIIMGNLKPTEGKVLVEGLDTVTQKDKLQRIIGLCPQHNLFFPYLSVMEHVMFFTLLKGVGYEEAKKSSQDLLKLVGLADKASCQTSQLSGGMKRTLQLACALAGDAKVLVLDEPTSGLDVETRRKLWDLLLSLRGSRTVLLSTHFMEEAEALGDRVAALHAGRLRCHATTMHLKRALGTGYRLSFTTIGLPDESAITAAINSKIPEATVNETSLNFISYNLPSKNSAKFPELFNFLKLKKSELGIDCIGIGASTLEDVFLKLCTEDAAELLNDIDRGNAEPVFKTVTGPRLYLRQLAVLFKRQLKYYRSKMSLFLIVKVIIPLMIIYGLTIMTCLNGRSNDLKVLNVSLNLDLYNKMADPRVLYSINVSGVNLKIIENKYPKVDFELAPNVTAALLRATDKNILEYNKYLVGVQLNETDATVLFSTAERYTPPVALNLLTNMIATRLLPYADGQTVTTYNYPINRPKAYEFKVYKNFMHGAIWAVMVVFVTLTTVVSAVSLPCAERASGTRHTHVLSGCAPALHWAATLLTHALIYALVLVLPAVVICVAFERDHTIDRPDFLVAFSVVFMLGIISFLALAYIVSFMFKERVSCVVLVSITFFFVLVMPFVEVLRGYNIQRTGLKVYEFIDYFLLLLSYGVPPYSLTNAAKRCVDIAAYNARHTHEKLQCYFCFEGEAPGGYMLAMMAQALVFMAIVILAQYGVFNTMCDRILNLKYRTSPLTNSDEAVHVERQYVEKTIKLRGCWSFRVISNNNLFTAKNQIQDAMLVNNLHKKYWRIFYSPCNPVKGVSFSVKKGECFGLVGVNGAGKSSMFKMMTGIEVPTRGSLYANGHFKTGLSTNYLRSLAYCPQSSGLDRFLTGYESLELVLTLRGLEQSDVIKEAKAMIKVIGLEKYANNVVSDYSGGCERQLAAAVALSRGAAVTLLDEPTAGVGVAARRRVWAALLRARTQRAVVVTSHSMDEMEALCGRIAIMVGGRVRALGVPAALRAAHTAGHAVTLKLATFGATNIADSTDYSKMLVRLKETLKMRLHWTLRQEQKTMLHFYINYTMRYSNLFSELEQLKIQFSIIEDYSVTETTLEEVFLTVTSKMYNDGPLPV